MASKKSKVMEEIGIDIASPDCVDINNVYDEYESANIEGAHDKGHGSDFHVGLRMVMEEVWNFLSNNHNIPKVIYTESSLIPERVGFTGKRLYDFIVVNIREDNKTEIIDLKNKIYKAYKEVYPKLHNKGYTVFNVPDFFMSPEEIKAIVTTYSKSCGKKDIERLVNYIRNSRGLNNQGNDQSRWKEVNVEFSESLFQRKVVLERKHEKEREERKGEAVRNARVFHKYFHEEAFREYYDESLLLSIPVVGASSGKTDSLSGMGGLFVMFAYEDAQNIDIGKEEAKHICSVASQIMKDFFSPYLFSSAIDNYKNRLKEERKSEISSIMSRNMSHNIGSHVLASPELLDKAFDNVSEDSSQREIKKEKDKVQAIHNFLQQRMDFIARIISYTPSWREPMFFCRDLLDGLLSQELLLGYLVKDQGYKREDISFYVHYKGSCRKFDVGGSHSLTNNLSEANDFSGCSASEDSALEDFLVAIPGGSIGAHAFYDILENVMRNSAKYGENRDKLEVHLNVDRNDDRYKVTLWDNLSPRQMQGEDRVRLVKKPLAEPLVDPRTGDTHTKGRGLQEVKECARLLAHPYAGKESDITEELNDWMFELESDGVTRNLPVKVFPHSHDGQEYLGYEFHLQNPHLVGIACPGNSFCLNARERDDAKGAGIYTYAGDGDDSSTLESLTEYAHQFGVIWMPGGDSGKRQEKEILEFIVKHHHLLPYRLLLATSQGQRGALAQEVEEAEDIPERRVHLCEKEQLRQILDRNNGNWTQSVLNVYELWLRQFKPLRNGKKWQMLILFQRGKADSVAFRKWRTALEGFSSDVIDVHVGQFHYEEGDSCFDTVKYSTSCLQKEDIAKKIVDEPERFIVFDNHRNGLESLSTPEYSPISIKGDLACYHEVSHTHALRLHQSLESPPQNSFGVAYFVLGLLESALADILIVDERLAEACFKKSSDDADGLAVDSFLYERLRNAGIHAVYSFHTNIATKNKKRIFISDSIKETNKYLKNEGGSWELSNKEGIHLTEYNGESEYYVNVHRSNKGYKEGVDKFDYEKGSRNADFIILHQGVLDRLSSRKPSRWRGKKDMEALYTFSPSIVITSGRGRNFREGVTPETTPFLEFSTIRESTYAEISKFHLARTLFSVVGKND